MSYEFVQKDVDLAPKTTMQVGGKARYYAEVEREEELLEILQWSQKKGLSPWILGGGSNVIIADAGIDGLVLRYLQREKRLLEESPHDVILEVSAGHSWDALVSFCVEHGWSGLEALSGIPGNVGAAPIQNIGAYGAELSDVFLGAHLLDLKTLKKEFFTLKDAQFSYRESRFKRMERGSFIILKVRLKLKKSLVNGVRYGELKRYLVEHFPEEGEIFRIEAIREAVLRLRRKKSMLWDSKDPNSRSVGSFFINPILEEEEFRLLEKKASKGEIKEKIPFYPLKNGRRKVPAAWLIERSGFPKGWRRGKVALSSKHTLAIVNRDSATAEEIVNFALHIQQKVEKIFGIRLQAEPNFWGFSSQQLLRLQK